MSIIFEWDENKNRTNHKKHDIWFEEAQKVFTDPYLKVFFDEKNSDNEDRYLALGSSENHRLLMVSHTYRQNEEVIRIISARRAEPKERKFYEEGI